MANSTQTLFDEMVNRAVGRALFDAGATTREFAERIRCKRDEYLSNKTGLLTVGIGVLGITIWSLPSGATAVLLLNSPEILDAIGWLLQETGRFVMSPRSWFRRLKRAFSRLVDEWHDIRSVARRETQKVVDEIFGASSNCR